MLFNSFIFVAGFLPATLLLFFIAGRWGRGAAGLVLTAMSLGFYAWWRVDHLPLLLFSILFNCWIGGRIQVARAAGQGGRVSRLLTIGLVVDVGLLAWFKYIDFIIDNLNAAAGSAIPLPHIALPLAISFFTFQKIAYLVDSARGDARPMGYRDFFLFAAFFPQLISGPIVHYKELAPQLQQRWFGRLSGRNLMIGLVIFAIGLFKKTVIADTMAGYSDPLFQSATAGERFDLVTGWLAALCYTFQLYFDFSGYSDMAIGLARLFGVQLPLNFHSPLRAINIVDYWRRWHMTLQRFIAAYIFQPLSIPMNRLAARRGLGGWPAFAVAVGIPSLITFTVSGLWHGPSWTFVLWGGMHAVYMIIFEAWREHGRLQRKRLKKQGLAPSEPGPWARPAAYLLTMASILFANVVFRSLSVDDATRIWTGMLGFNGLDGTAALPGLAPGLALALAACFAIVGFLPNTQQIMARYQPAWNWAEWRDQARPLLAWEWRPDAAGLVFAALALFLGLMFIQRGAAVFLYFNF
jgi:D-alanyl-lipoteichoic acid acyltransferase DltB (MBOAT superfamily)